MFGIATPVCALARDDSGNYNLVAELSHAAVVGGHGVGGGGDGAAHNDVVGADLLGGGGGHDALLVADVAVSKTDTGGDGQEVLAAAAMNLASFQGEQTMPSRPAFLAVSA